MKIATTENTTKKQREIFKIGDEISEEVYEYSIKCIERHENSTLFQENSAVEVISFFINLYSNIFCHGFMNMLRIKRKLMKDHESTEQELLKEAIDGILLRFNGKAIWDENYEPTGEIKRIKVS